ncbi:MAG: permease [Spirochaetales bacterium]|uniref:Permease n=1 Tax=Candidatus Thalassospirochaeta sargassi TaxID=3119039 RepID=A0AAJ1IEE2_9SPIO|nr:permease [Spirochaetales bacterium]
MKKKFFYFAAIFIYLVFISISFVIDFEPGKNIGLNFTEYAISLVKIVPCAFILVGLFEVWVKREVVEKNLGKESGIVGYFWAILLGGVTIGPMIVALPVAQALHKKGASMRVIFTYLGASATCRIPMTIFEATCVGIKFTIVRYAASIPLLIIFAAIYGRVLDNRNYSRLDNTAQEN